MEVETVADLDKSSRDSPLSLGSLKEIIKELWDARTEWFKIGLSLQFKPVDLKAVEKQHRADPNSCFTTMLEEWLKRDEAVPTWKDLVTALQSVGMDRLADKVERNHYLKSLDVLEDTPGPSAAGSEDSQSIHPISSERELLYLPLDNWFEVGLKLGLSKEELKQIQWDHSLDTSRMKMEMLTKWFQSSPEASYETLIGALAATDNKTVAEEICSKQGVSSEIVKQATGTFLPNSVMEYSTYLKEMYAGEPIMQEDPWPPPPSEQYIDLVLIKARDSNRECIELENIFSQAEHRPLKVLIDGDPGSGKSTLCRKIAYNWSQNQLLTDFSLLVLIPLRDPEIASSNNIDDFFYHDDVELQNEVVKYVRKHQGNNVVLIFDGFDELSHYQRTKLSIFLNILQGKKLSKCSVIVACRHYASQKIEGLHTLTQHVEVLGFSRNDVQKCIKSSIQGEAGDKLICLLERRREVFNICENPLNCAIVIFVFKEESFDLPQTLTEIYTCFLSNVLTREADIQGVESKSMLEPDMKKLQKLAYENCIKDRIVLEEEDVRKLIGQFKTLGLLTATKGFMSRGRILNYRFTHLTIQEFLAAKWIHSNLTPEEAGEFLNINLVNDHFKYVLLFLSGLSNLEHKCYQPAISGQELDLCTFEETLDHKMFITRIQLIHEAQNAVLCQLLSSVIKDKVLKIMKSGLNLKISAPLAYFIDKSCCTWEVVDLMLIHSNFIQFVWEYQATNKLTEVKNLVLHHQPIFRDYGCCTINDVSKLLSNSHFLKLKSLSVCSPFNDADATSIYVPKQNFTATPLKLVIMMGRLRHLTLHGVIGASTEVLGLHSIIEDNMNILSSLDLKSFQLGLEIILAMGLSSRSICQLSLIERLSLQVEFPPKYIMSETEFDNCLKTAIEANSTLHSLNIRSFCSTIDIFGLYNTNIRVSKFLYGIAANHCLRRITLGDMDLDPEGLTAILMNNHTLQTLNLVCVQLNKKVIWALATGLKNNRTLRNLCLIDSYDPSVNITAFVFSCAINSAFSTIGGDDPMMSKEAKPEYSQIPYHIFLKAIITSEIQGITLDFHPGELLHSHDKFFHELILVLLQKTSLTRLTLNYSYCTEDYLAQVAKALVLNGRRNEIDLTFGASLNPSLYSRHSHSPFSVVLEKRRPKHHSIPEVLDQELLIQKKVDEFKELMFKNMLITVLFILNTRTQRQVSCVELHHDTALTLSALRIPRHCVNTQRVLLMNLPALMLKSMLRMLSFILTVRKEHQVLTVDKVIFHEFVFILQKILHCRFNYQRILLSLVD